MLLGQIQHSLDNKGRLIVPSKYREDLGEKFIVTKGLDACLSAYPLSEWKKFEEKLSALPVSDKDARKFVRFFLSGAAECEPDTQGRVIIPQTLREYANLEKDVISIGVNNRVEIWNKDSWNNYNADENFIDNELAERMAELGI